MVGDRVIALDPVGKSLAVAGRTARIGIERRITGRGVDLVVRGEARAVTGVGAAVDFEDHRQWLALLPVGGKHDPAGDLRPVGRRYLQFAHLREALARQFQVVERGQARGLAAAQHRYVGGPQSAAASVSEHAAIGHAPLPACIGTRVIGIDQLRAERADAAAQRYLGDLVGALVLVACEEACGVPLERGHVAVEVAGDPALVRPVAVHHVDAVLDIGHRLVVIAKVGDLPSVRRDLRIGIGTVAVGQRGNRARGHVDRIDFAVDAAQLPVLVAIAADKDGAPVGRPFEPAAVIAVAMGQLARRAADRIDEEDLRETGREIAGPVIAIGHAVDDLRSRLPLGAFGRRKRRAELERFGRDVGRKGDALAVGRPCQRLRRAGQGRDVRALPAGHPAHVQFGPAPAVGRDIGEAIAAWRPARAGMRAFSRHQRRFRPARHVDHPDRGNRGIGHDIVGPAHIGDALAIRADLRIGRHAEAEQVLCRKVRVGRILRMGRCGKRHTERDETGVSHEKTSPAATGEVQSHGSDSG